MLLVVFTLDYEIHGNGEGCPYQLMVEPTRRLLNLFDEYGAKLTIMADAAEIKRFSDYKEQTGHDEYHGDVIVAQLQDAVKREHDVQLHLHSSYFNAREGAGHWAQDWSEYNLAGLPAERVMECIGLGKDTLEQAIKRVAPEYRCIAFRAANWSMTPSRTMVQALIKNGFKIDSSVFKYGRRSGLVNFDYRLAPSALVPWKVDENDICARSETGQLLEFPIYSENRWIGAFITPQRIHRLFQSRRYRISRTPAVAEVDRSVSRESGGRRWRLLSILGSRHAWKADFNQCGGRQLIRALERAERASECRGRDVPFVLIGHSKLFTRYNEARLRPLLRFIASQPERFGFSTFTELDSRQYGRSG